MTVEISSIIIFLNSAVIGMLLVSFSHWFYMNISTILIYILLCCYLGVIGVFFSSILHQYLHYSHLIFVVKLLRCWWLFHVDFPQPVKHLQPCHLAPPWTLTSSWLTVPEHEVAAEDVRRAGAGGHQRQPHHSVADPQRVACSRRHDSLSTLRATPYSNRVTCSSTLYIM